MSRSGPYTTDVRHNGYDGVSVCPQIPHGQGWQSHNANAPSPPGCARGAPPSGASNSPGAPSMAMAYKSLKAHRRTCSVAGCKNGVVQGGVCVSHGAKRRLCRFPGCTKNSKNAGLCSRHGPPRKKCEHPNCSNVAVRGGKCKSHGAWSKTCSVEGCTKVAAIAGMCKRHNFNAKRTPVADLPIGAPVSTNVDTVVSSSGLVTDGKYSMSRSGLPPASLGGLYTHSFPTSSIPPSYYAALDNSLNASLNSSLHSALNPSLGLGGSLNGAPPTSQYLASQMQSQMHVPGMSGYYNPASSLGGIGNSSSHAYNAYNMARIDDPKGPSAALMLGLGQGLGPLKSSALGGQPNKSPHSNYFY